MKPNTKSMTQRKTTEVEIKARFECLQGTLTERSRRLFVGSEALAFGYGGIAATSRATGLSPQTVSHGLEECQEIELGVVPAIGVLAGGRKKLTQKHPQLLPSLKKLVESTTRGDPESPLLWTARSQLEAGEPAISVDTKKKELMGAYKNTGRELRPKGHP